ncbi:transcriptional repressor LexA [Clostridium sp. HBUAS56010]|uniref:transcriptional repressor LexA n=1 Tax=Clostridium sp. HBUAS56010 TaxID=2571127 RepID=UPI0011775459|nr:transcriptional repressor LexA [Clostridium sp. HBUAS56010]
MNKLTKKQQLVLDYIKQSILKNGYPPTVREIATEIGVKSASTVQRYIEVLIKKEYMRRDPTKPRTIEIIDDCFNLTRREVVNVPVLGTVAASQSLYAEKNIENCYPIPSDFLPNEETFMLKMRGNSMINAGILEGDQIIVKMTSEVKNNDIVVALIDDIITIKRFFKEDGHYRLQPENDSMEPIIVDHVKVLGKVIGLFRKGIHNI